MDCAAELREMYNLPDMTFPVILLSLGYPKVLPQKPQKLKKELMVFEGRYPTLSDEKICAAFDGKYADKKFPMPARADALKERLIVFRRALRMSFSEQESDEIIATALERGYLTEIQRLFGVHYHPDRESGYPLTEKLLSQKLYPFTSVEYNSID